MAYSKEFWGKPEEKKDAPAIPLELLAKQAEEQRRLKVNEQGQVLTEKELQEQKMKKSETDEWREQK